ncbi:MAG TPA: hypothetical protein VII31_07825 [Caldimonas sp.]
MARIAAGCLIAACASASLAATKAPAAPSTTTKAPPAAASAASAAPTSAPSEFAGHFEAGHVYVAEVAYDANALRVWRPVKEVQVAPNSAWTVEWTNIAQFPALASASARAKRQRFRFKVLKAAVSSGAPTLPWTYVYSCELIAVDGIGGPSAPAGKRR